MFLNPQWESDFESIQVALPWKNWLSVWAVVLKQSSCPKCLVEEEMLQQRLSSLGLGKLIRLKLKLPQASHKDFSDFHCAFHLPFPCCPWPRSSVHQLQFCGLPAPLKLVRNLSFVLLHSTSFVLHSIYTYFPPPLSWWIRQRLGLIHLYSHY
jgi:hypothetical protein